VEAIAQGEPEAGYGLSSPRPASSIIAAVRSLLCTTFVFLLSAPALADTPRVGFANVATDGAAGQAAIDRLREDLAADQRVSLLPDGPARIALERPLPATAPGEAVRSRATALAAQAREQFAAFEYDRALESLREADSLLRALPPAAETTGALADLNLLAGLVHVGRKDNGRALESFRVVRRLDPQRTALDAGTYRPAVVDLYAKTAEPAGPTATLQVDTEPPGASVQVDGKVIGPAPVKVTVEAGDHYIWASREGHIPRGERARLDPDRTEQLYLLLGRQAPEDRAAEARRRIAAGAPVAEAAGPLGELAPVAFLVLVRTRADGTPEAALLRVRDGKLGEWGDVQGGRLATLVASSSGAAPLFVPSGAGREPFTPDTPEPEEKRPWYRTGWGLATIIGGSVLVLGTVLLLTASGSGTQTFTLEPPTWE
jgi:hypothetical protein